MVWYSKFLFNMKVLHVILYLLIIHISCSKKYIQYPKGTPILKNYIIHTKLIINFVPYPIVIEPDLNLYDSGDFYAMEFNYVPVDIFNPYLSLPYSFFRNSLPLDSSPSSTPSSVPIKSHSTLFDPTKHPNWNLVNDEKCGSSSENRIVGGINASLGQYPWLARIGYTNGKNSSIVYRCGGSLISKIYVVTAAHCVINLPGTYEIAKVRLGEYDTSKEVDCVDNVCAEPHKDFDIKHIVLHRLYGEPKKSNDIAIIQLNETVVFTEWITPICLPFGSLLTKNLTGSKVDIAGWGYYDVSIAQGSVVLQTIKLPVLKTETCKTKFRRYKIDETKQICVGGQAGRDSCNGDSGGPLMKVEAEGNDGPKIFLFGIVSFGAIYCGMNANPAVYTRVTNYLEWILDNLKAN